MTSETTLSLYDEVIEDMTALGHDFRLNDLDETMEVSFDGKWQRMNDTFYAIIELQMREMGYGTKIKSANLTAVQQSYMKRAHQQRYNPIKRYFESVIGQYKPQTGKAGNVQAYQIPRLAEYFTCTNAMFEVWLFRWLVGAVGKVYGGVRNPMLVLASEQRTGKSWFSKWLCPVPEYFTRGGIKPDNKDDRLKLGNVFLWEAEELDGTTRKADIAALKSFLTLDSIYERMPYGKFPLHKPTVTSFIGTVNPNGAGFLADPTGSTRFLVSEVIEINFAYSSEIDLNQIWAEAAWFWRNIPDAWRLTREEESEQEKINAEFETMSSLQDMIETLFTITFSQDDFMNTRQIRTVLINNDYKIGSDQMFFNELARVAKRLNLERGRLPGGGPRGYYGIKAESK